jgi:hypothetical protein
MIQFDMFGGATTLSSRPSGLIVRTPSRPCRCGSIESVVGSSAGPHRAELTCAACAVHAGWLSAVTYAGLEDLIQQSGRPEEPISLDQLPTEGRSTMAKEFDDELKGVLFRDERKKAAEDRDFSRSATIEGTEYWLSAWSKVSKGGKKYLSLSFKAKNEAPAKAPLNDDIGI